MKTAYQIAEERRQEQEYNKLLAQYQKKQTEQQTQSSSSKEDKGYKPGKIIGTVLDFAGDIIEGASKGIEGILDFGASLLASDVGYAVGIFNPAVMMQKVFNEDKFSQKLENFAKKDLTGKSFGKLDDAVSKNSYINDLGQTGQNIVHGVGEGIGQMLPAVAVTVATAGAGAPAVVSQVASTATFAVGAGGNATEQALNEGASVNKAVAYGTLVGGTEALIETASGKILGGTNIFKPNALKESMKGGAKAVARNFIEEGTEEVISEVATPFWKQITYGDRYEAPSFKQLTEAFVTGGITAVTMGGAQIAVDTAKYGKDGAEFNSKMQKLNELNKEEYQKEVNGELTKELKQQYDAVRESLTQDAIALVEKMSDSQSDKVLKRVGGIEGVDQLANFNAQKTAIKDSLDDFNKRTGNNLKVDYVTDKDAPYNGFYDRKTNTIKVFEGAENSYSVVLAHEAVHSLEKNNGYSDLSNAVLNVLGKDKVNSEYAELRKYDEYKNLNETELNKEIVANYLSETFAKSHKELRKLVVKNRNIITKVLDYVNDKLSSMGRKGENHKQLQSLKTKFQNVLDNNVVENNKSVETDREVALQYSKKDAFLYNGYYIKSYSKVPSSIRENVLSKIVNEYNDNSQEYLSSSIVEGKYLIVYDIQDDMSDITSVINIEKIGQNYNFSHQEYMNFVKILRTGVIKGANANADIIKLIELISEKGMSSKSDINFSVKTIRNNDRRTNYGVSPKKSRIERNTNSRLDEKPNTRITGLESYSEEELNSIVKNYVVEKLNENDDYNTEIVDIIFNGSRTKGTARNDSDLDVIVEFKGDWREDSLFDLLNEEPLEIDGIKVDINPVTEDKSGTARDYYERTNKYNPRIVKDSQGTILTKEQSEYFKNSKVVDEDGNLLFLYHGSPSAEFNVFDEQSQGKNTSSSDKGFYFTNNKDVAETFSYETKPSSIVTVKRTEKKGSVKSFYLNIENMLDLDNLTQSQIDFIAQSNPLNLPVEEVKRNIKQFVDAGNIQGIKMYLNFDAIKKQYDGIKASMYSKYQVSKDSALDGVYEFVAFHPEQIKLTTNKNPSENPDIRYSVKKANLTEKQEKFFEDSKARDEDGNLVKVYHGTTWEFFTFDKKKANPESDMGKGFYFSNEIEDANWNYADEDNSPDLKNKIARMAEQIEYTDNVDYDEAKKRAKEILVGSKNNILEVYLNIKNPIYSDTRFLSLEEYTETYDNYSIGDFENEDDYYQQIEQDFYDEIDGLAYKVDSILNLDSYNYDELEKLINNLDFYEGYTIESLKKHINENYEFYDDEGGILNNEVARAIVEALGYDGIIDNQVSTKFKNMGLDSETVHYIAFKSNQIKLVSNENPTSSDDIRYSIKKYSPSQGQNAKFRANYKSDKVYSKADAMKIYEEVIIGELATDETIGYFKGKGKSDVINQIFIAMNKGTNLTERMHIADKLADYLVQNAVAENIYEDIGFNEESLRIVDSIKYYMHKLNLDNIQDEIKHKYGKKSGISLVWGKSSNDKGISIDTAVQELNDMGIQIDMTDAVADQFFEMLRIYDKNKKMLVPKAEQMLKDVISKEELDSIKKNLAENLLRTWSGGYGSKSLFQKKVDKFINRISELKTQVYQAQKRNKIINRIVDIAQNLRDIGSREYVPAGDLPFENTTELAKRLGQIKTRSDVSKGKTRKIIAEWGANFYNDSNPLLEASELDQDVLDDIAMITVNKDSDKELSYEELSAVERILANSKHIITNFDTIFRNGKKEKLSKVVEDGYKIAKNVPNVIANNRMFAKRYLLSLASPKVIAEVMDGYHKDGIMTSMLEELKSGETKKMEAYMDMMDTIKSFFKENKGYEKTLTKEKVKLGSYEITKDQALYLAMLNNREQAKPHIYMGGVTVTIKNGKLEHNVHVKPTAQQMHDMIDSLSDLDREFMEVARKVFNKKGRDYKIQTDMVLKGFTNVEDGNNYIPIKVDSSVIARNMSDVKSSFKNLNVALNQSFNKEIKANAGNKLKSIGLSQIIEQHANDVATYYGLAVPLKNWDMIYNRPIYEVNRDGTKIATDKSIKVEMERIFPKYDQYASKLLEDIQGVKRTRPDGILNFNKAVSWLRSNYATFQLGLNVKVWFTQLSSLPTAHIHLSWGSIAKGAVMKTNYQAMDKYCSFAKFRNYDKVITQAETLTTRDKGIKDKMTAGINLADRVAIGKSWNACQLEIEKTKGFKIGTEENLKEAGMLLEKVIRDTQPNYSASERSSLERTDSEITKSFLMFMSQPLKNLSMLLDGYFQINTAKQMLKSDSTNAQYKSILEDGKKKLKDASVAVLVQNIAYVMMATAIKKLLNKDDDEDPIGDITDEFIGSYVGMFPFVRDAYNYFAEGYEVSNFAVDGMNSLYEGMNAIFDLATAIVKGETLDDRTIKTNVRKSLYGLGQFTGYPTRNLITQVIGATETVAPSTGYKMRDLLYKQSYTADLEKAVANGDDKLAETIIETMLSERKVETNKYLIETYRDLYEKGFNVFPTSVKEKFSHEGTEYTMNAREKNRFAKVYNQSEEKLVILVKNPNFKSASDEVKTKAINLIYDYYYAMAKEDYGLDIISSFYLLGKTSEDISKLSLILAEISQIESDLDKNGKTISGSKKNKIFGYLNKQKIPTALKYLIMGYLGYKNTQGENIVKAYLDKLGLSKEEKESLLIMAGYLEKDAHS